jgi:hypothetical protein
MQHWKINSVMIPLALKFLAAIETYSERFDKP